MNKKNLIKTAAALSGMRQNETAKALSAIIEAINGSLENEESVVLMGFGTFSVKNRAERQGINPLTKQSITISARKTVRFKASKKA